MNNDGVDLDDRNEIGFYYSLLGLGYYYLIKIGIYTHLVSFDSFTW